MFSLLNKLNVFFYLGVSLVIIDSNSLCSSTVTESSESTSNRTDQADGGSLSSSQHQEDTAIPSPELGFEYLFDEVSANSSSSEKNETTEDHSEGQKLNEDNKEENEVKQDQYLEDLITEIRSVGLKEAIGTALWKKAFDHVAKHMVARHFMLSPYTYHEHDLGIIRSAFTLTEDFLNEHSAIRSRVNAVKYCVQSANIAAESNERKQMIDSAITSIKEIEKDLTFYQKKKQTTMMKYASVLRDYC
jgi:hypothetical protein